MHYRSRVARQLQRCMTGGCSDTFASWLTSQLLCPRHDPENGQFYDIARTAQPRGGIIGTPLSPP